MCAVSHVWWCTENMPNVFIRGTKTHVWSSNEINSIYVLGWYPDVYAKVTDCDKSSSSTPLTFCNIWSLCGLYSSEVCLSFVFPMLFPYSFSHSPHKLPSFLLSDIVHTLLFLASVSYLLTAMQYWQKYLWSKIHFKFHSMDIII